MTAASRRKLGFVLAFSLFFAGLWLLWDTAFVYPLKIFVVLLHELSHAAASVATGGSVEAIVLDPMEGGACHCPGGNAFAVLSAGYLGSLAWGGAMFAAARSRRIPTHRVNTGIGVLVLVLTVLFVRSGFGIAFGLLFGMGLLLAAAKASRTVNRALLFALGLTSTLYAILDIKSDVLDRPELRSDARMLAEITGVPTLVWGAIWIGLAVVFSVWLLRKAYREA